MSISRSATGFVLPSLPVSLRTRFVSLRSLPTLGLALTAFTTLAAPTPVTA